MTRRRVQELMNPDVVCLEPGMTVGEAERILATRHVGGAPVVDESGALLGILTLNDIARYKSAEVNVEESGQFFTTNDDYKDLNRIKTDLSKTPIDRIMSTTVYTVARDANVATAANIMRERRIHRLVVTERGRLVGMISTLDLLRVIEELC